MATLNGRVAIVTGAGRGLGRSHARYLAARGARVVVNDLGTGVQGDGASVEPAERVVAEIREAGGEAVASAHDVGDWDQAAELVELALAAFGDLHVLVNNAGILRDRSLARLAEHEWDAVIRVHLKGHAAPTHHAFAYWRQRSNAGEHAPRSVIHTASPAVLGPNFGQAAYTAAKMGILGLSTVAAAEGIRYGIRSNAVAPSARTRMAMVADQDAPAPDGDDFDPWDPANTSRVVGWLADAACGANGQIFQVLGRRIRVLSLPRIAHEVVAGDRWTPETLADALDGELLELPDLSSLLEP